MDEERLVSLASLKTRHHTNKKQCLRPPPLLTTTAYAWSQALLTGT